MLGVGKLVAGLLIGLLLGAFCTGAIMLIVVLFGNARGFDTSGDKLGLLIGGTLTTALYAGLGVGLGLLVRNQVGALVGALLYVHVVEPLIGALMSLSNALDDIMPRYSLGAVGNGLAGLDTENDQVLHQVPAGLLLTLYVAIFVIGGLVMMQRRDITA
jgi:ABC-2 type transport system permease protein